MYKAILVDDEKIVRLALKTIVDWTALGYTVTGSYSSVKTALLEIEDDPPDLIITDIKMPDMDGLQFIQQVRQQNRECEIIVLTNHENFSYAVEAIRLGVMDYVVKTDISPESLTMLLQKAVERLAKKKGAEPVPVTPMTEDDFREMQRVVQSTQVEEIRFSEPYAICLAFLDRSENENKRNDSGFYNLLCEKLGRPASTLIRLGPDQTAIVLMPGEQEAFKRESPTFCQRISGFCRAYLNRPCGFLLSEQFADSGGFLQELERCRNAIPYVVFHGTGSLTRAATLRRLSSEEVPVQVVCWQLSDLLEAKDYTGAQELFSTFGRGKELRATAPGPAAHAMSSLGLTALLGCSAYLGEEERRALWEQMIKCRSVDDYEAHFGQVLQQMERFERKKAALLCKKEMAQIIQYIEENLSQHISLEMISETVHMTENYVSRLFKSESGMNVVGYINMEKMEQARRLLSRPESTVRMAAGELGYYESSYFIKLFRKTYGVGPGEYKKFAEDRQAAPLLKTEE